MGLLPALALAQAGPGKPQEKPPSPAIADGSTVRLEYTLKDDGGEVLDSSEGGEPLTYTHGRRQIIPGLERALHGMRAGDSKHVEVAPKDAYGVVDPSATAEVPKQNLPPNALVPGTELVARRPDGSSQFVRVKEVRAETVVLDLNHPLAGKTLFFDVRILEVVPAEKP